jgi:hypothetical protein
MSHTRGQIAPFRCGGEDSEEAHEGTADAANGHAPGALAAIRDMALDAGILTQRIERKDLVGRSFIPAHFAPAQTATPGDSGREQFAV